MACARVQAIVSGDMPMRNLGKLKILEWAVKWAQLGRGACTLHHTLCNGFYVELHNGHVVGVHKSHMAQAIPSTAKVYPSIVPGKGTTKILVSTFSAKIKCG
jgi:hypothetical protein